MKKYQSALALALLGVSIAGPLSTVQAADTEFTPTITINREKLQDNKEMVPAVGIKFKITHVDIKKLENFDMGKPETYKILNTYDTKEYSTDENGQIKIGSDELVQGYYIIEEEDKDPFLVSLPFTDENGKLSDDIVMHAKTDLIPMTPGTPTKPGETVPPEKVKPNEEVNKTTPDNVPAGTIMQMSGKTSTSILVVALTSLMAGVVASVGYVRNKIKKNA